MEISNQQEWRLYQIHNTNVYGRNVMNLAQVWANKMEIIIDEKGTLDLNDVRECFHIAFSQRGATRIQTSAAMQVLTRCWKYSELLGELIDTLSTYNGDYPYDTLPGTNANPSYKVSELPNF